MSLFGRALGIRAGSFDNVGRWANASFAGRLTTTGQRIDAETGMKLSTVWAGVHLIANSLGMLPMGVFEHMDQGRQEARNHPLWDLLRYQPNNNQTAGEFRAMLTAHALLRGDGYARIVPGARGFVDQLIPIHPDRVVNIDVLPDYSLRYAVLPDNGRGKTETLLSDEVFHLRGLTLDGINGVSFIRYGAESLGLARAAEGYAARVFKNDATPRGVLEHPGKLSKDGSSNLKQSWNAAHQGENQHSVAVLEEGLKFHAISITPGDTQLLQSREYQDVDIARWLGVPLFLLQIMTKSTSWGSGLEQTWQAFIATGLGFWATRWEQAISRDLILNPRRFYVKINLNALAKGALLERTQAYNTAIFAGYMTRNEVRALEDLNPLDGLDEPLVPLNMRDVSDVPEPVRPSGPPAMPADKPNLDDNAPDDAPPDDSQARHYRELLAESAGRVVRKELAALTRADLRTAGDADAWQAAVKEFYVDSHVDYVAQTMRMSRDDAAIYVDQQRGIALATGGLQTVTNIADETTAWLCDLASGKV